MNLDDDEAESFTMESIVFETVGVVVLLLVGGGDDVGMPLI